MVRYSSGTELAAVVSLVGFAALSAIDGIYVHLVRFRLHTRPASFGEHLLHTGRAILFVPLLLTVFGGVGGALLWVGLGTLAVDQALEMADTIVEPRSRAGLGGLTSGEYVLHITLSSLRAAAIAFALAGRPSAAWSTSALAASPDMPLLAATADMLLPGALLVGALHVALAVWGARADHRTPAGLLEGGAS
jgi:hypothetical protein